MTTFCDQVWEQVGPIRQAMLEMPFNVELRDGTLSRERFQFYMLQDSVYLKVYARVLALCAARVPESALILEYAKAAETAMVVLTSAGGRGTPGTVAVSLSNSSTVAPRTSK